MSNPLTADMQRILNTDPLAEAEDITGKSYKTSEATMALGFGMHLKHTQEKRDVLAFNNDSHYGTKLEEYIAIVTKIGFVKLLERQLSQKTCGEVKHCKQFVFYDHQRGILLHFDTYSDGVNSGNFYFNWRQLREHPGYLPFSGHDAQPEGDERWVKIGSLDCREAIKHHIEMMNDHGEWVTPWIKRPWMWLLTWADTKNSEGEAIRDYDHHAITQSVISQLPPAVQKAITPERRTA